MNSAIDGHRNLHAKADAEMDVVLHPQFEQNGYVYFPRWRNDLIVGGIVLIAGCRSERCPPLTPRLLPATCPVCRSGAPTSNGVR